MPFLELFQPRSKKLIRPFGFDSRLNMSVNSLYGSRWSGLRSGIGAYSISLTLVARQHCFVFFPNSHAKNYRKMDNSRAQFTQISAIYNRYVHPQTDNLSSFCLYLNFSDEFHEVYNLLFTNRTIDDLQKAMDLLSIWSMRMPMDNPELKNTEILLQITLRDQMATGNPVETNNLLCSGYSMALTKFLNNLCRDRYQDFRVAVAELGLESFVVDLRNVGNHSNSYASIELYRRTVTYCFEWLRREFWDKELVRMQNIEVSQIKGNEPIGSDVNFNSFLLIYDGLVEALEKHGIRSVKLINTVGLAPEKVKVLTDFAGRRQDDSLNNLFRIALTEFRFVVLQADTDWLLFHLTDLFLSNCDYFFESRSVKYYQPLIRLLIRCHQLRKFCERLLCICENAKESTERRAGALFWLEAVLDSMNKFKHLKDIPLDDSLTEDTCRNAIRVYKQDLGVDLEQFLMIGDMQQRPWTLEFNQPYLIKRLDFLCEYTKPIIVRLLKLASPAFSAQEVNDVEKQLDEYFSNTERRLKRKSIVSTENSVAKKAKFGVWSTCSGEVTEGDERTDINFLFQR
jgi:predicted metal-binding transcription factor (methanogenesis marker protein 9)